MGGIPSMLLMIAAAGVTYGWQPDKNGDDPADIEYIVQVSPAELAQLKKSGSGASFQASTLQASAVQISSVIDPEVRGHVSRIVLRVGTGDLPRTTSSALASPRVATLKPDPQGGGGFGLPSTLKDSAGDALNNAANQFGNRAADRAGRAFQNGVDQAGQKANNLLDRIRGTGQNAPTAGRDLIPPPSTRPRTGQFGPSQSNNNLANQNQSNPFAQPRAGGPSTSPTGQKSQTGRDNQWSRFAAQQQQQNSRNQNSRNTEASLASNGLRPSDTFGRMPNALKDSDLANTGSNANRTSREQDPNRSGNADGVFSQIDQTRRDLQFSNGSDSLNRQTTNNQQSRTPLSNDFAERNPQDSQYLGLNRPNPKLNQEQLAAGAWDFDRYNRLVDRSGRVVNVNQQQQNLSGRLGSGTNFNNLDRDNNSQASSRMNAPSLNNPSGFDNNRITNNGLFDRSINSTLGRDSWPQGNGNGNRDQRDGFPRDQQTRDQFAGNSAASMMDTRDGSRGVDNRGRGYSSINPPNQDRGYNTPRDRDTNSQYDDRVATDTRFASQIATNRNASDRPTYDRSDSGQRTISGQDDRSSSFNNRASSDRGLQAESVPTSSHSKPKPVAAQPLFNGLLLISIVANLYLIFWLKNLRVQFKEMVTAKRMSNSTASVA